MMQQYTINGSEVKVKINGKVFPTVQSISIANNSNVREFRGVDDPFAQEIAATHHSVQGSVQGIRIRFGRGIQAQRIVSALVNFFEAPYNTIEIVDRSTSKVIIRVVGAVISNQNYSVQSRGLMSYSFNFVGQKALDEIDII